MGTSGMGFIGDSSEQSKKPASSSTSDRTSNKLLESAGGGGQSGDSLSNIRSFNIFRQSDSTGVPRADSVPVGNVYIQSTLITNLTSDKPVPAVPAPIETEFRNYRQTDPGPISTAAFRSIADTPVVVTADAPSARRTQTTDQALPVVASDRTAQTVTPQVSVFAAAFRDDAIFNPTKVKETPAANTRPESQNSAATFSLRADGQPTSQSTGNRAEISAQPVRNDATNTGQVPAVRAELQNPGQFPAARDATANPGQMPAARDSTVNSGQLPAARDGAANPGQLPAARDSAANLGQLPAARDSAANPGSRAETQPAFTLRADVPAVQPKPRDNNASPFSATPYADLSPTSVRADVSSTNNQRDSSAVPGTRDMGVQPRDNQNAPATPRDGYPSSPSPRSDGLNSNIMRMASQNEPMQVNIGTINTAANLRPSDATINGARTTADTASQNVRPPSIDSSTRSTGIDQATGLSRPITDQNTPANRQSWSDGTTPRDRQTLNDISVGLRAGTNLPTDQTRTNVDRPTTDQPSRNEPLRPGTDRTVSTGVDPSKAPVADQTRAPGTDQARISVPGNEQSRIPADQARPGDQSRLPGDQSRNPGDQSRLPGDQSRNSADQARLPGDQARLPGDQSRNPADQARLPGDQSRLPGDQSRNPADQARLPGDQSRNPADQARLPGDQARLPGDQSRNPADQARLPGDQSRNSADQSRNPADQARLPGDQSRNSADPARNPNADQTRLPSAEQSRQPGSDQSRLPNSEQSRLPNSDQSRLPNADQSRIPGSDQSRFPNSDQSRLPNADQARIPGSEQSRSPFSDTRNAGNDGKTTGTDFRSSGADSRQNPTDFSTRNNSSDNRNPAIQDGQRTNPTDFSGNRTQSSENRTQNDFRNPQGTTDGAVRSDVAQTKASNESSGRITDANRNFDTSSRNPDQNPNRNWEARNEANGRSNESRNESTRTPDIVSRQPNEAKTDSSRIDSSRIDANANRTIDSITNRSVDSVKSGEPNVRSNENRSVDSSVRADVGARSNEAINSKSENTPNRVTESKTDGQQGRPIESRIDNQQPRAIESRLENQTGRVGESRVDNQQIKPGDANQSVKPADATQPVKSLDATQPVKSFDANQPVRTSEATQPARSADANQTNKIDANQPIKAVEANSDSRPQPPRAADTPVPQNPGVRADNIDGVRPTDRVNQIIDGLPPQILVAPDLVATRKEAEAIRQVLNELKQNQNLTSAEVLELPSFKEAMRLLTSLRPIDNDNENRLPFGTQFVEAMRLSEFLKVLEKANEAEQRKIHKQQWAARSLTQQRRVRYLVKKDDTLDSIAANVLGDARLVQLLITINRAEIIFSSVSGTTVPLVYEGQYLWIPTPNEVDIHKRHYFAENAAAVRGEPIAPEAETPIRVEEFEAPTTVRDFATRMRSVTAPPVVTPHGPVSSPMALVLYRLRFAGNRNSVNLDEVKEEPQEQPAQPERKMHRVRLGETLQSIAIHDPQIRDVNMWALICKLNGLDTSVDVVGRPRAQLSKGDLIALPTPEEIIEFRTLNKLLEIARLAGQELDADLQSRLTPVIPVKPAAQPVVEKPAAQCKVDRKMAIEKLHDRCRMILTDNTDGSYGIKLQRSSVDGKWITVAAYDCQNGKTLRYTYKVDGSKNCLEVGLPAAVSREMATEDFQRNWRFYYQRYTVIKTDTVELDFSEQHRA